MEMSGFSFPKTDHYDFKSLTTVLDLLYKDFVYVNLKFYDQDLLTHL